MPLSIRIIFARSFSAKERASVIVEHREMPRGSAAENISAGRNYQIKPRGAKAMLLILLIIIVLLLLGGGGSYGQRAGWGPRGFGGLLITVLIVVLLIWVVNELTMPPLPMPAGVPSIIR
jgi:hypothetical protein